MMTGCLGIHVTHEHPVYVSEPVPVVAVGADVAVSEPPPAAVQETVVAAPGPEYIWIGGYWGREGGHWRWEAGHWARPPRRGAVWVAPKYYHRSGHDVWVPGSWR
jgi:hypothetical protein